MTTGLPTPTAADWTGDTAEAIRQRMEVLQKRLRKGEPSLHRAAHLAAELYDELWRASRELERG